MKCNKFLFIAMIFLVSLLCVSAVSAADDSSVSDIVADTNDVTVLEESVNDVNLADSQSDENVLKENPDEEKPLGDTAVLASFYDLNRTVNNGNAVVDLTCDYSWFDGEVDYPYTDGVRIDHDLTINGNGHIINGSDQARIFCINNNASVTFKNIVFANGYTEEWGYGGAIWGNHASKVVNCTFIDNHAHYGGAIAYCSAIDCSFINNGGKDGGAIYQGNATNSHFINNTANYGGAIAYDKAIGCTFENNIAKYSGGAIYQGNAENCTFTNNNASDKGGAIFRCTAIGCNFTGNSAKNGGAICGENSTGIYCSAINCTFNNNTATNGGAIFFGNAINSNFTSNNASGTGSSGGAIDIGNAENCIFTSNIAGAGGAIHAGTAVGSTFTANQADAGGAMCGDNDNRVAGTAINCTFNNNTAGLGGGIFFCNATNSSFTGNSIYQQVPVNGTAMSSVEGYTCQAVNCIFTNNNADGKKAIRHVIADSCIFIGDEPENDTVVVYNPTLRNFNFITTYDDALLVVNITSNSGMQIDNANIKVDVYTSTGTFVGTYNIKSGGWKLPFGAGAYVVTYNATDYDIANVEGMIIVDKSNTTVSSSAVTAVYNNNKYLVITLRDSLGRAISGAKVTVTLASAKTYTTDKNGQIKINIGTLVPKAYTAKISFAGNDNYLASSTTAKVTVKKAAVKLTAKAKTFKVKVKTKKYTVTLKNNKGKVLKKVKLTLKVGKKTYKATTNSKGKATFKITKLTKKGKYTATIKFAGNKYYNKLSKKVKITVKK